MERVWFPSLRERAKVRRLERLGVGFQWVRSSRGARGGAGGRSDRRRRSVGSWAWKGLLKVIEEEEDPVERKEIHLVTRAVELPIRERIPHNFFFATQT